MSKKIQNTFLAGLAVILPLGVTFFVLAWILGKVDSLLSGLLKGLLGFYVPGMGFACVVILIFLTGLVVSNVLGKKIHQWIERVFYKIPVVKLLYSTTKEIFGAVSNNKNHSFSKVVLVEFPNKGVHSMGFITNDKLAFCKKDKICVFIPTTPNPTNGFLVFVPKEDVEVLDMPIDEGLKLVVSMGSVQYAPSQENEDIIVE